MVSRFFSKSAILALVLVLVVSALFSVGITNGHIGLDDWGYTSGCPFVKGGLTAANITRAFTDFGYGAIWMPVTFMSYMTDVSLFGDNWQVYHAVNVALHVLNALLVFFFVRAQLKLFAADENGCFQWVAFLAALLWSVHPMRAESVTFVAARKEELWTLFSLLGLLSYGRFLRIGGGWGYAVSWACFVLACLSKPTAIAFPFLAGALHMAYRLQERGRKDLPSLWRIVPLVAFAALVGLVTLYSQSHPTSAQVVDIYETSLGWRLLNASVAVGLYFWYTLVPFGIHMDYRAVFDGVPVDCALGLSVLVVVSLVVLAAFVRCGRETRIRLGYTAALFLFSLGPTLGVFGYVNGDQSMADRYSYFPHIALALLLAFGLTRARTQMAGSVPKWLAAILCGFVVYEVILLIPVVRSYESGYTACSRALEKDPDNWRALRIVGNEYCARQGRMDEGVAMLRKSLSLRASQSTAESLAYILSIRGNDGDFKEVKRLCAGVIQQPVRDTGGMMLDALGIVAMREANYPAAIHYFTAGLKASKRNHSVDHSLLNLGLCLANAGRDQEALGVLQKATASRNPGVRKRAEEAMISIRRTIARPPFQWE